ncbi:hypothetical protein DTO271D3_2525 [Paecilomyces variotii]|nr:hypothetical protein DTO212C5_536 [Paecilomyces variotii]KAJ9317235.1 hypothetical protein DTO271D3_2525 [Paecilomyces variotii]
MLLSPDAKHFRHFSPAAAFFKHATCKLHHPLQILLRPPLAWFLSIQPVLEIYSSSFPPAVAVFSPILTCNRDPEPLPIDWCTGSIRLFPRPDSLSTHPSVPSATTQNSPGSLSLCMTVVDNRSFTRLP